MTNIKIRQKEENKTPIKVLDKKLIYRNKLKNNMINLKEKTSTNESENDTPNEYVINKISEETNVIFNKGIDNFNKYGRKSLQTTNKNIKQKIQNTTIKNSEKKMKGIVKNSKTSIKTLNSTSKTTPKKANAIYKNGIKETKKMFQIMKLTVKNTARAVSIGVNATIALIKAIIVATKELVSAVIAGGWVAVVVIIAVCLILLICSSIFGISSEDLDIVKVASSQIGNVGGQPYWSWYGYDTRVEWCACFVSWCANQCNYIEKGIIPKFSNCENGVEWFKSNELWQFENYIPKSRRYNFF